MLRQPLTLQIVASARSNLFKRARNPTHSIKRYASQAAEREEERPNIYKHFGRPFAKVFLGAFLTFQVLYWGWEKMRMDEIRQERLGEIESLKEEIESYKSKKTA